ARIENHYFSHGGFFDPEQLVDRAETLNGIPGIIVQGRYDMVTPVRTAWELSQRWEDSVLQIVEAAGHAADEPAIASALVEATDSVRVRGESRGIGGPRSLCQGGHPVESVAWISSSPEPRMPQCPLSRPSPKPSTASVRSSPDPMPPSAAGASSPPHRSRPAPWNWAST